MNNLIYDIGVGAGQDTYFYLNKGFNVIGIEADPVEYHNLQEKFATEINSGSLILVNAVATNSVQSTVNFYRDSVFPPRSSIFHKTGMLYDIPTVNYSKLVSQFSTPYYCKIDIEGSDVNFLKSMNENLPKYTSAEVFNINVINQLQEIGYTKFKLVNQSYSYWLHSRYAYQKTFENSLTEGKTFVGELPIWLNEKGLLEWSGLFGQELDNDWVDFNKVKYMWRIGQEFNSKFPGSFSGGAPVYDCHATF